MPEIRSVDYYVTRLRAHIGEAETLSVARLHVRSLGLALIDRLLSMQLDVPDEYALEQTAGWVRNVIAAVQLVEDLEKELGERVGGFRIEDEDLEDLKTVRDAVDYVVARL